jgi:hypothetical protein
MTMMNLLDAPQQAPQETDQPEPPHQRGWLIWPMLLLLGYLLFAHGCHAEEDDDELFMRLGARNGEVRTEK